MTTNIDTSMKAIQAIRVAEKMLAEGNDAAMPDWVALVESTPNGYIGLTAGLVEIATSLAKKMARDYDVSLEEVLNATEVAMTRK